jgi:hypothetical protein
VAERGQDAAPPSPGGAGRRAATATQIRGGGGRLPPSPRRGRRDEPPPHRGSRRHKPSPQGQTATIQPGGARSSPLPFSLVKKNAEAATAIHFARTNTRPKPDSDVSGLGRPAGKAHRPRASLPERRGESLAAAFLGARTVGRRRLLGRRRGGGGEGRLGGGGSRVCLPGRVREGRRGRDMGSLYGFL